MARPRPLLYGTTRLRLFLGLLFVALALPMAVLVWQTRLQLRWEALHQYRTLAEELAARIDADLQQLVGVEEARSEADYRFLNLAGDPQTSKLLQRSVLAEFPVRGAADGLLGYFAIDADGRFSTPLLPETDVQAAVGLDAAELAGRLQLRQQLFEVLGQNRLLDAAPRGNEAERLAVAKADDLLAETVASAPATKDAAADLGAASAAKQEAARPAPAPAVAQVEAEADRSSAPGAADYAAQSGFDELAAAQAPQRQQLLQLPGSARLDQLKLGRDYQVANARELADAEQRTDSQRALNLSTRGLRKEQNVLLQPLADADGLRLAADPARVRIFEAAVEPFEFGLLASGHGVLYRKVWRDGRRSIQGAIVDAGRFTERFVASAFRGSALAPVSDLVVAWQQDVLQVIPGSGSAAVADAAQLRGELLYQTRLSAPFDRFQLVWSSRQLPDGPGARIVNLAAIVLGSVLLLGFLALYRTGLRQLRLARQQQDFISAVSHELKTPLTSIRMYAEMLRAGWASEARKADYYDYIHDESERLSRLIANVLQLARMERNDLQLDVKPHSVATLFDLLRSKLASQLERAGYDAEFQLDEGIAQLELAVDVDAYSQVFINLVDNAIKFSQGAALHRIEVHARPAGPAAVLFSVRDFGPGVPKAQMQKIFRLFYRAGDELTRESPGTGIGLALVRQLAQAMGGEVDVVNRMPGAEFRVRLPVVQGTEAAKTA